MKGIKILGFDLKTLTVKKASFSKLPSKAVGSGIGKFNLRYSSSILKFSGFYDEQPI